MTTRLTSPIKRELDISGQKFTLTVAPDGFKLVLKGKRKGIELGWDSIVNGDAALSSALTASLQPRSRHGTPSHHTGT